MWQPALTLPVLQRNRFNVAVHTLHKGVLISPSPLISPCLLSSCLPLYTVEQLRITVFLIIWAYFGFKKALHLPIQTITTFQKEKEEVILGNKTLAGGSLDASSSIKIIAAMNEFQKCSQCLQGFSEERQPLQLASCAHYICRSCLYQALGGSFEVVVCGFCQASIPKQEIVALPAPQEVLINSAKHLSARQEHPPESDETEGVLLEKDEVQDECSQGVCGVHKVPMDIICISDLERICPHCALFGNHKDHRFKRIEDFEKQVKQKIRIFDQITAEKNTFMQGLIESPNKSLQEYLRESKEALQKEIRQKVEDFIRVLRTKEEQLFQDLENVYKQLEAHCKRQALFKRKEVMRAKLDKWEEDCGVAKQALLHCQSLHSRITHYFNSPLQIVNEGSLFLQELKRLSEEAALNIQKKVKEVRVSVDTQMEGLLEKCMRVERIGSFNIDLDFVEEVLDDTNPFLDCTSSEIAKNSTQTLVNNSIEVDISSLVASNLPNSPSPKKLPSKQDIKSLKSIEKKDLKETKESKQPRKKLSSPTAKLTRSSRVSQICTPKPIPRMSIGTSLKQILAGTEVKASQPKQPEKIYNEFSRNSLTDFFDISECNLSSEKVVEFVTRARRIHRIRGLKLSSNHLTAQGFEKMLDALKGVGNINLANNDLTEGIFDILLKNRDRLDALKIINLSHNPIVFEKKTPAKIEELKRMGVVVIL